MPTVTAAVPKDVTLPAAPVKVRYTGASANIALYELSTYGVPMAGIYLEVLRSDDMTYKRDGREKRPTKFFFKLWVHNGKQRWREMRWVYQPKTVVEPGPLKTATVGFQLNKFLREI